ncbi:MAG: pilus assembly protein TadB, partial [Microbacterium sp.]
MGRVSRVPESPRFAAPARRRAHTDGEDAAGTVLRVAVLLQAGAAPDAAWRHLAGADARAAEIWAAVEGGASVPHALRERGGAWVELAAVWEVATTVGAPLAASLR